MNSYRSFALSLPAAAVLLAASAASAAENGADIKALYDQANVAAALEVLDSRGPRVAAGPAEAAAADYLAAQFESYGLATTLQRFPAVYFEDFGSSAVANGVEYPALAAAFTQTGSVTGALVDCGIGQPWQFPPEVAGNIALIRRGTLTFFVKVTNAVAAGAAGIIFYNNVAGDLRPTLRNTLSPVPAVMLSKADGALVLAALAAGPVEATVDVNAKYALSESANVVATLPGVDPDAGVVYVGAHYDTVSGSAGGNDNSSGTAALLEAARVLAERGHRTAATIKFLAFGAEELGAVGSYKYAEVNAEELAGALGMINLDMVGAGTQLQIGNIQYPNAATLTNFTLGLAAAMDVTAVPYTSPASSDHIPFEMAGIPTVMFHQWFGGYEDPDNHSPRDTLARVDLNLVESAGELATAVAYGWAKNPSLRERKMLAQTEAMRVCHGQLCSE